MIKGKPNAPGFFGQDSMPKQQQQQQQGQAGGMMYETLRRGDGVEELKGYISNMNAQAQTSASNLSKDVDKLIKSMKVSDALGYEKGMFDVPSGVKVGEQVISNASRLAHQAYEDGILGSMMMANGRVQEGLAVYSQARQQGDAQLSMMQRVANQYRALSDPNASDAEKAMARTNLGKSIGNRQELVQSIQSMMPGVAALAAAKISTEAAKAQTVASSYGPLASLIGLQSQRFNALLSGGGGTIQNLDDVVKANATMATVLTGMMQNDDLRNSPEFDAAFKNVSGVSDWIAKSQGYQPSIDAGSLIKQAQYK